MKHPRLAPLLLVPVCALLAASGCAKKKTVVVVTVTSDASDVVQLDVKVRVGAQGTQFFVPRAAGEPITFPTDFTIEIDPSRQGALDLTIDALDAAKEVVAEGSGGVGALVVGQRNDVTVILGNLVLPPPDGGAPDGGPDGAAGDGGEDAAAGDGGGDTVETGPPDVSGEVAPEAAGADDAGADTPGVPPDASEDAADGGDDDASGA
jgi:hypothetical protein